MGRFLRMSEERPKDLGGPHADQIFAFRGSPECFAVRLPAENTPALSRHAVENFGPQTNLWACPNP